MELIDMFRLKIQTLKKCINDFKKQKVESTSAEEMVAEAEEERKRTFSQEGYNPLKSVVATETAYKYDIAELFSPPR